jgi:hypothetical protein
MRSTDAQIRKIQAEIDRQEVCRRQIAKLERELKEADEAVRTGTETLILSLAEARGISLLTPAQILAVFDSVHVPTSEAADSRPPAGADAALFDGTGEIAVAVRFGNHEGNKKKLLKAARLTRNGKVGEWHGRVDRATLMRLREAFRGKVTELAIHPQSTPTDVSAGSTAGDASAVNISGHSAGEPAEACETVVLADNEAAPSAPGADPGAALRGLPEAADGVGEVLHSGRPSTPIPRGPFSVLPRRLEPKRGDHHEI